MRVPVPVGHPRFGEVEPCLCWEREAQEARSSRLLRISNLTGPLARLTFESLDPSGRSPDPENCRLFQEAFSAAHAYAQEPKGWLVLTGPSGSGKTHLACAIGLTALQKGIPVLYLSTPDLLDHLRSTFAPTSEVSYDLLFEQVRNVHLLIMDDLGAHASTPWAQEKLFQVLNHRFLNDLPTVIVLSASSGPVDERLRTRLEDPKGSRVLLLARARSRLTMRVAFSPEDIVPEFPTVAQLKEMTFDTFDVRGGVGVDKQGGRVEASDRQRASLEAALKVARHFAQDPQGWLVLKGPPGVGKTHLAVAIVAHRLKAGHATTFIKVPDFLDHLRSAFSPGSPVSASALFEGVKGAPFLVLDDLGSHFTSEYAPPIASTRWAEERLYHLLSYRYDHRLPTVITMDNRVYVMDPLASRVADQRLVTLIEMDAPDYRAAPRLRRREA